MTDIEKPFAFVLMPFRTEFDDVYQLAIKAAAEEQGILAERVDEQKYSEGMLDRIHRQIEAADFVIADMSNENANVFYEIGYAVAKDKLCITIIDEKTKISFDLSHKRHIVYKNVSDLKLKLLNELEWAKSQLKTLRDSSIKATIKSKSSILNKTKYSAEAEIDFAIDLTQISNAKSAEIEYSYFYCGKGWTFTQNGIECPSSTSDLVDKFKERHILSVPARRVSNWVQINFTGRKTVGWATKGDVLHDEYNLKGNAMFRLCTDRGNFDYEFTVDETVNEIPF